jgi:2-(1,2-epoxy-1,2-dihydrophenyl)acetyl-CoA isomerase
VVAAVHGAAAGAGLALVLATDLVVSSPTARYTMAYANLGLTPDCGVAYLLPHVVGLRRAFDLALNGRVLPAEEALDWGLVSEVADDPLTRATALARTIADGASNALGHARRLLRSAYEGPRDTHAEDEARTISAAISTHEAQALIAKFTNR